MEYVVTGYCLSIFCQRATRLQPSTALQMVWWKVTTNTERMNALSRCSTKHHNLELIVTESQATKGRGYTHLFI